MKTLRYVAVAMLAASPASVLRAALFAPLSQRPGAHTPRGKIVCTCLDVAEGPIRAALEKGESLEKVQATLKCGTSCGSCVPELKRIVQSCRKTTPASTLTA